MFKQIYEKADKSKVWWLAGTLIAVVITEIVLTVLIPAWRQSFYNLLELKVRDSFAVNLGYFSALMIGLGAAQGLKIWVGQLLSFEFRKAGSKILLKAWVKGPMEASNYSQAQTEGLRNATELYLSIVVEAVISASIVIFLVMSNIHNMPIVVASLIYTAGVSVIAVLFNRPLTKADVHWQEAEGKYREALGDIANGRGDFSSKSKFLVVIETYYKYVSTVMCYRLFSQMKGSLASVVPYILLASPYFTGAITLGTFMAGVSTFELIVINATILTVLYPTLTKARASYAIVNKFFKEIKND